MASIEHDLFIEWMKWLQSHSPSHKFTYDGIVCIEEWQATPTKVLLVLKDYNDSSQADRHLPLNMFNIDDREAVKANVPNLRYHLANSISGKKTGEHGTMQQGGFMDCLILAWDIILHLQKLIPKETIDTALQICEKLLFWI